MVGTVYAFFFLNKSSLKSVNCPKTFYIKLIDIECIPYINRLLHERSVNMKKLFPKKNHISRGSVRSRVHINQSNCIFIFMYYI